MSEGSSVAQGTSERRTSVSSSTSSGNSENGKRSGGQVQRSGTGRSSFVELATESMSSSKQNVMASLTAGFFSLADEEMKEAETADSRCGRLRSTLNAVLGSAVVTMMMCIVITADVAVGIVEINATAAGTETPNWVITMSTVFLVIYTADLAANLAVLWPNCRNNTSFLLDAVIVGFAIMDYVVQAMDIGVDEIGLVRFLRVFRVMRLLRIFRKAGVVKRLNQLLLMAASSVKTLLWTFLLCACFLLFWSMAAVDLLHPVVQQMDSEDKFEDCARCGQAFSSVQHAFLTLFKLTMTGEDFGLLAEPLMLERPWSAALLMGSMLSVVYGILNLVVAVVVDEFAERRANDFMARANEMDDELRTDTQRLNKIFHEVDEDGSGEVSLEELQSGAKRVPEFRNTLRWMDIDEADIQQLFAMLDDDDSGEIESAEFVGVLSRWMRDSKTAGRFVKYGLQKVQEEQASMRQTMMDILSKMNDRLKQVSEEISVLQNQAPPAASAGTESMKSDFLNSHSRDCSHHAPPPLEFTSDNSTLHFEESVSKLFKKMNGQLGQLFEDLRLERASRQQAAVTLLQSTGNFSEEKDTTMADTEFTAETTEMHTPEARGNMHQLRSPCQPGGFLLLPPPKDLLQSRGDSEQENMSDAIDVCRV